MTCQLEKIFVFRQKGYLYWVSEIIVYNPRRQALHGLAAHLSLIGAFLAHQRPYIVPACWKRLLTALRGAVASVGIPSEFNEVVIVFRGIVAILNAPPTMPCTPL